MRISCVVGLVLLLQFGAAPATASPEDPKSPEASSAADRAQSVRAALEAPNPATALRYEGESEQKNVRFGTVNLVARAKRTGRSSVWSVEERIQQSWGGERLDLRAAFELSPDLTLRSGSYKVQNRGATYALTLLRTPAGDLQATRAVTPWKGATKRTTFAVDAPADVMVGTTSLALLARHMGKGSEHRLRVSKLDLYGLAVRGVEGNAATHTLELERSGRAKTLERPQGEPIACESVAVRWQGTVPAYLVHVDLHLSAGGRSLVGRTPVGHGGARAWWPKGSLPAPPALPEEGASTTWEKALLKFGFGYHMARRELIEAAFHWDRFRAHEIAAGSWKADEDLEAFKAAWIDAFFEGSEHRSRAETTQLLNGTLKTGTARKVDDDHVVFKADPQFGGGVQRTYYLARQDGIWRLERIEF